MLARKFRLPASVVIKKYPIFSDSTFLVKAQENNLSYARFGFVVSKTVDKKAVVRNRLKRMVRAFIEDAWLNVVVGHDILFVLRPPIKAAIKENIKEKVNKAMAIIT